MDKLSAEEKAFLDKFSKEYYTADFRHDKPLHGSKQKTEIYQENNTRNFDTFAIKKGTNKVDELKDYNQVETNREDKLIALLDAKLLTENFFNLKNRKKKSRKPNSK